MNHSLASRTEHGNQHAAPAHGAADDQHEKSDKHAAFLKFPDRFKRACQFRSALQNSDSEGELLSNFCWTVWHLALMENPSSFHSSLESFGLNSSNLKWCQFSVHGYPPTFLVETETEMDPSSPGTPILCGSDWNQGPSVPEVWVTLLFWGM